MQKLIDANRLERKAKFNQQVGNFIKLSDLKNAPTIDAEPVVRCKDCKFARKCEHPSARDFRRCTKDLLHQPLNNKNHYCGFGAKMNEEL